MKVSISTNSWEPNVGYISELSFLLLPMSIFVTDTFFEISPSFYKTLSENNLSKTDMSKLTLSLSKINADDRNQ